MYKRCAREVRGIILLVRVSLECGRHPALTVCRSNKTSSTRSIRSSQVLTHPHERWPDNMQSHPFQWINSLPLTLRQVSFSSTNGQKYYSAVFKGSRRSVLSGASLRVALSNTPNLEAAPGTQKFAHPCDIVTLITSLFGTGCCSVQSEFGTVTNLTLNQIWLHSKQVSGKIHNHEYDTWSCPPTGRRIGAEWDEGQ